MVVRFDVRDPSAGGSVGGGSCTTGSNGKCAFTYSGPLAARTDSIVAYVDANNNNARDPEEPPAAAQKTWFPVILTLSPDSDSNPIGGSHTVTARVTVYGTNDPVAGMTVRVRVTGAATSSGSCTTDATGECGFTYPGPVTPGVDTISAYVDANNNGAQDADEPVATASKTWVAGAPATLTLSPATATNTVGTRHTVKAQAMDSLGSPTSGIAIRFTVTGSVTASGTCTTGPSGECDFTYLGPALPGADAITAYADTSNDNAQSAGEPGAAATKAWILPLSIGRDVHGAGQFRSVSGNKVTFEFTAKDTGRTLWGNCNLTEHVSGSDQKVKCLDVKAFVVAGNVATIYGTALHDGSPTMYVIKATDDGKPGTGSDTFSITTADGYVAAGTLEAGNIHVKD
jgi:hypothetical protein